MQSWISAREKQKRRRGAKDCGERIKSSPPLNPCSETAGPDSKLDPYLARQTIGRDGKQNKDSKTVLTFSDNKEKKDSKCGYCENSHAIAICEEFKGLDVNSLWESATGKRVCFKCLSDKHRMRQCK